MRQIILKPQDLVVALKIAIHPYRKPTFAALAQDLAMSASQVHASTKRGVLSGILIASHLEGLTAAKISLQEFVIHGARYAFPGVVGSIVRGVATASAGPTLSRILVASPDGPPVWPQPSGTARGPALAPLYPKVPEAVANDSELYDVLTLIDAIRIGGARDRELAAGEIKRWLA